MVNSVSLIKLRTFHGQDLVHCTRPEALLSLLGGPSEILLNGKDPTRTRVIVTLLHANEPSGITAMLKLMREGLVPATNVVFIIASVNAALTPPLFYHRMLPNTDDLNRCFSEAPSGFQGILAQSIKQRIAHYHPEFVVDVHNTSGDGPAFCVSTQDTDKHINLASHFVKRIIVTDIELGSLMEQSFGCPIITFEAGGSDNASADNNAYTGLLSALSADNLNENVQQPEILFHPRRLELKEGVNVEYADSPITNTPLTLRPDIEKFNFGITPQNTALGWVHPRLSDTLQLDQHSHLLNQYFHIENKQLVTSKELRLFMVTTRADIASSDCLFYFHG